MKREICENCGREKVEVNGVLRCESCNGVEEI